MTTNKTIRNVPHEDASADEDALLMLLVEASVTESPAEPFDTFDDAFVVVTTAAKWPPSGEPEVGIMNGWSNKLLRSIVSCRVRNERTNTFFICSNMTLSYTERAVLVRSNGSVE